MSEVGFLEREAYPRFSTHVTGAALSCRIFPNPRRPERGLLPTHRGRGRRPQDLSPTLVPQRWW